MKIEACLFANEPGGPYLSCLFAINNSERWVIRGNKSFLNI